MVKKIFVWNDELVLRSCYSGLIVVSAASKEEALAKLRETDICAWGWLQTGWFYIHDEECLAEYYKHPCDHLREWKPLEPKEYDLDTLPILVSYSGDG